MHDDIYEATKGKFIPVVAIFIEEDGDVRVVDSVDMILVKEDYDAAYTFLENIMNYFEPEFVDYWYKKFINGEPPLN